MIKTFWRSQFWRMKTPCFLRGVGGISRGFQGTRLLCGVRGAKGRAEKLGGQEGKGPDVIVELLSESTAKTDKTTSIYQNQMRVPEYFWYDPFNPEDWKGFKLINGVYKPLELVEGGYISEQINLKLVLWEGSFKGLNIVWLRWATLEEELLPTQEEKTQRERERKEIAEALVIQERQQKEIAEALVIQERQQKEIAEALVIQERAEKEQERQKKEKLAAYLRSLGINPDEI
jgi:hypothetical protein